MADIEVVIKIPEEMYAQVMDEDGIDTMLIPYDDIVKNGTPLLKGHGKLIDADDLDITTITTDDYSGNEVLDVVLKDDIDDAPTIIKADKGENNANT